MNLKGILIGIAILVLTMFVTTYGVDMIFEKPVYEDFCPVSIWKVVEMNESTCFDGGGKWIPTPAMPEGDRVGYCEQDYRCSEAYDLAKERHSMNIFLITIPLGILILLVGFFFFRLEIVGVGIMAGGIGTLLRGIGSYWRYTEDWLRFSISLIGLIIVIIASYKFNKKFENKSKKRKKK